jgi:hypothetical protein
MRKRRDMTCEEFSASMAQLVASGRDIFAHPHVKRCKMHRALLEDLEIIARAAQQLFPDLDPSDKVWAKIEDEIATEDWGYERTSDPFPGCQIVFRVRVTENWKPQDNSAAYDDLGERIGHKPPPHPREGWR